MINQPPVDLLIEKLSEGGPTVSRYCLCVVAAKRARQIIEQTAGTVATGECIKELAIASQEIASGKIRYVKD